MPYSKVTYTGDGDIQNFAIPYGYLEQDDLTLYVNDVETSFSWLTNTIIQTAAAPAADADILIQRVTDIDEPKVDFSDGSTLTAEALDKAIAQLLYAIQELHDRLTALENTVETIQVEAGNLPEVDTDDNGKILRVVGGAWSVVSPVTRNAVIDVQVDAGTYKFQKKTADLVVIGEANVTAWTDFHTGGPCA